MLDHKFIVENLDAVKRNIGARFMKADADAVAALHARRTALSTELQALQKRRNEIAAAM